MTPQEFAAKIRTKYPGAYDNVPDDVLAKKVVEKYPVYGSQVNFSTPKTTTAERAKEIYNQTGNQIVDTITDNTKSPIRRGFEATASAFSAIPKVITAAIPSEEVRSNIKTFEENVGSGFKKLTDFIGSNPKLVEFTQKYPDATQALEEILATTSAGGEIAGNILAAEGAVKTGNKLTSVADEGVNSVKNMAQNKLSLTPEKQLQETIDLTSPVMNKKDSIAAFERSGQKGGAGSDFKVIPDDRAVARAQSVQGIVSKDKNPIDNIVNINGEIERISETEITPFLRSNPSAFNKKTLNSYIQGNIEIPNFIKADATLQKTYDLTRQSMLDVVDKYPKTMEGLWKARKEFDAIVERQLGNLDPLSEKASAARQAVLDTRRAVNDFIADSTPNGDEMFKAKLKDLSLKYEARGNIAEQSYKLLNKNAIERFIKNNPKKAKAIKYALEGLGIYGGVRFITD